MEEKRELVAQARLMREGDPDMPWQAIADRLDVPRSSLMWMLENGVDGCRRGRPPSDTARMVETSVRKVFDEYGIPRKGGE